MVRIAPIRLALNPKTLWFDPGDLDLHKNDAVVVSTARGSEFGCVAEEIFEADEAQVKKLKSPLKPVMRLALDEDVERAEEMRRRSDEALPIFKEMASEASEDMHPVSVEFLLDGDKAVFYFEAEERVDFRDLVRKLAARFHVRIDMRQIGVRDEARMIGGLGHCGQELCCKRMGGEFCPVSIRMAKEQDLSLNPQKISGVCGRLMCCLRYEFDAYKDFKSRAPKQNAQIHTPLGIGKVVDLDVPREVISVRVDGEKPVKIPLADFEPPEEGTTRPNCVGKEAWEDATAQAAFGATSETIFLTSQFTSQDKLADPKSTHRAGSDGKGVSKPRKGSGKAAESGSGTPSTSAAASESRKPRRRRSTKVAADGTAQPTVVDEAAETRGQKSTGAPSQKKQGQRRGGQGGRKGSGNRSGAQAQGQGATSSVNAGNGGNSSGRKQEVRGQGAVKSGPRPGQKSSGLRQQSAQAGSPSVGGASAPGEGNGRRRRRSHKAGGSDGQGGSGSASGRDSSQGSAPQGGSNET